MRDETEKLTACGECDWLSRHLDVEDYEHLFCKAPRWFDPIDAVMKYSGSTTYCSKINTDGHCPHWKAKEPEDAVLPAAKPVLESPDLTPVDHPKSEPSTTVTDADLDYKAMYHAAIEAQRWIPVGERLPENEQDVLTADAHHHVREACYHSPHEQFGSPEGELVFATHWMPLPLAPEVESCPSPKSADSGSTCEGGQR